MAMRHRPRCLHPARLPCLFVRMDDMGQGLGVWRCAGGGGARQHVGPTLVGLRFHFRDGALRNRVIMTCSRTCRRRVRGPQHSILHQCTSLHDPGARCRKASTSPELCALLVVLNFESVLAYREPHPPTPPRAHAHAGHLMGTQGQGRDSHKASCVNLLCQGASRRGRVQLLGADNRALLPSASAGRYPCRNRSQPTSVAEQRGQEGGAALASACAERRQT